MSVILRSRGGIDNPQHNEVDKLKNHPVRDSVEKQGAPNGTCPFFDYADLSFDLWDVLDCHSGVQGDTAEVVPETFKLSVH
jgi:hypothetical protein